VSAASSVEDLTAAMESGVPDHLVAEQLSFNEELQAELAQMTQDADL
jgi:hypothetical protein